MPTHIPSAGQQPQLPLWNELNPKEHTEDAGEPLPQHPHVQSILTRSGGSDDLLYHQGHAIPQVITGLGKAPPVPLRAFRLGAVIPMDDLLQAKEQQKGKETFIFCTLKWVSNETHWFTSISLHWAGIAQLVGQVIVRWERKVMCEKTVLFLLSN